MTSSVNTPKQRNCTQADLAAYAGVSQMTVNRALRGHPHVRPEIRRRIQSLAAEHHYRPSSVAFNLKAGRTRTVGVVLHQDPHHHGRVNGYGLVHDFLAGIGERLARHGYKTLTIFDYELCNVDGEDAPVFFRENCIDGLICTIGASDEAKRVLRRQQTPVLWMDAHERPPAGGVWRDEAGAVELALAHLREQGHRDIVYLHIDEHPDCPQRHHPSVWDRRDAYEAAMRRAGLRPRCHMPDDETYLPEQSLAPGGVCPPTAVICYSVREAFWAMRWALAERWRIPEDISVISVDSAATADRYWPELSRVVYDRCDAGRIAGNVMIQMLKEGLTPGNTIVPAEQIVGQTVAPAPRRQRGPD